MKISEYASGKQVSFSDLEAHAWNVYLTVDDLYVLSKDTGVFEPLLSIGDGIKLSRSEVGAMLTYLEHFTNTGRLFDEEDA